RIRLQTLIRRIQFTEYGVLVLAILLQEMDDPNINMAEYIQLEEEKPRRRGQEFNWETGTYDKVRYFKDIDYFKDFENQFPAIVYNDTLTFEPEVSSEPTISAYHAIKIDFDFKISSSNSDDEDYTFFLVKGITPW
ncbi:hypothetical protein Tco_0656834, partial [Tanacetum coccineum]